MSAVSGILSISDAATNEWVSEYQDTILVRNAKGMNAGTTLFGLMSRLKNEPAETTDYKWFERDPVKRVVYASAANTNTTGTASLTIEFDDNAPSAGSVAGIIQSGSILVNTRTSEGVRVTNDGSSDAYTVERAVIGSAAAINNNDEFVVITLGKDEGATPVNAVYENPTTLNNYIQTFNSTVELTNAFKGSKLRTDIEGPLKERRVQALERIGRDIELAYFFGAKLDKAGTNGRVYYTGGITNSIDTHGQTSQKLAGGAGSGVSMANFKAWLEQFMVFGSDAKLAFAGPKAYSALSNHANSESNGFRITGSETVFGMNIQTILTPFGEISLAMHPLFKEISAYNSSMVVCDLPMLVQKYMEPLFLEPNIQTPGQDSYKEQFRAKYGLKLKFAEAFGYAEDLQKINA